MPPTQSGQFNILVPIVSAVLSLAAGMILGLTMAKLNRFWYRKDKAREAAAALLFESSQNRRLLRNPIESPMWLRDVAWNSTMSNGSISYLSGKTQNEIMTA